MKLRLNVINLSCSVCCLATTVSLSRVHCQVRVMRRAWPAFWIPATSRYSITPKRLQFAEKHS